MTSLASIVVPVLNEDRLLHFAAAVREALDGAAIPYELVVVDDGPSDARVDLGPNARILEGSRRGKGRAVGDGMLAAAGDVIVVVDADLEALLPFLPRFVSLVRDERYDVVIAERQPDWAARHPIRFFLSYGLYLMQRLLIFNSMRFRDTQCGFKAFRGEAAKQLASLQRIDGGMYDIEYLYIAVKNGFRIAQVPVGRLAESRPSRIRILKCLRTDPFDLLRIKWRGLAGRYGLQNP